MWCTIQESLFTRLKAVIHAKELHPRERLSLGTLQRKHSLFDLTTGHAVSYGFHSKEVFMDVQRENEISMLGTSSWWIRDTFATPKWVWIWMHFPFIWDAYYQKVEQSKFTSSHLCGLKLNEAACSTPDSSGRNSGQIKADPAYAASIWSHSFSLEPTVRDNEMH